MFDNIRYSAFAVLLSLTLSTVGHAGDALPTSLEDVVGHEEAACPFFTLIPSPTSPTCNGYGNGIASVLEPTDGVGPYTYQWIGGPATREWHNVGAGTYTVIVVDIGQGGMACNLDVFVNEPGPLTLFALNGSPPTCAGTCNGQAAPMVIGGNGGYSLSWSSGETGYSPTALCATFTLHIEDQAGCTFDTTVTYTNVPDPIDVTATVSNVVCFGDDNGSIDAELSGGTPPYAVSWSGPAGFSSTDTDIFNLAPGTYTIDIEDANLCSHSADFTITENPELLLSATVLDNPCHGDALGEIDLTIVGGASPYSAVWSGPNGFTSSDIDLTGLESGLYEVTVTDAAGCSTTLQTSIAEPAEITVAITAVNLDCFEDASGEATASASGGSAPYTYDWTGPNGYTGSGPGITGLAAGTYTVTATDASGCFVTGQVEVDQPPALNSNATITEITCASATDGAIDLTPLGGTPPYTTDWIGPNAFTSTSEDLSGLEAGDYEITITDQNGCVFTTTYSLSNPVVITVTGDVTQPSCVMGSTGSIDLTVTNGTPPYDYAWTGPAGYTDTSEDQDNLAAGTYDVVVTDANGCQASASFTISPPAGMNATFDITPVSCSGGDDGAITTTVVGGSAPYGFMWLGPAGFISTDQNLADLSAGGYNLMITDANGCSAFFTANVPAPSSLTIANTRVSPSCHQGNDGEIHLTVSGGTPPFNYAWSGPDGFTATTRDITGLTAGTYTVDITDAAGCVTTRQYTLSHPDELIIDGTVADVTCHGQADGSIDATISGGTPGYLYSWTGPGGFSTTSEDLSNLANGQYTLEVTDAQGCSTVASFEVVSPPALVPDVSFSDISCFGASDGSISLSVLGGTPPIAVSWIGPSGFVSGDFTLADLAPGTYSAEITDANGCSLIVDQDIIEPAELVIDVTHMDLDCFGDANGEASVSITGGTAPYQIQWSGPNGFTSDIENPTNLESGVYAVVVTDAASCSQQDTVTIAEPSPISATIDATDPDCLTDNGSVSASVTGGTVASDYDYQWTNTAGVVVGTTSSLTDLPPGNYTLLVTDDNGCTYSESVTLTRESFNVSASVAPATCSNSNDGVIAILAAGGVSPYTYDWNGPNGFTATGSSISNLEPGNYQVTITDATGCSVWLTYDVDAPSEISFDPTVNHETCATTEDGSIQLNLSGGSPGYSVVWSSPAGYSDVGTFIQSLAPGDYTAEVTDNHGCTTDTTITIDAAADLTVNFTFSEPACHGEATGEISAGIGGGTPPYTYQWAGPNGFTSNQPHISMIEAGIYVLNLTDANLCSSSDTITLSQPSAITIETTTVSPTCQQSDGGAYATATGGSGDLTFSWSDSDGNPLVENDSLWNVSSGLYILTVTDTAGCFTEEWVTLTDAGGSIDGIPSPVSCFDATDGAIDITVVGGTEPYTYEWSDTSGVISTAEDLTGVGAGQYVVYATDANGCIFSESFDLLGPDSLIVSPSISNASCLGGDGTVVLTISGGTSPYDVQWTGPNGYTGTGVSIDQLEAGVYSYILSDANGCTSSADISVDTADAITPTASLTHPLCHGEETGQISLETTGGVPPLSYSWSGPDGFGSNDQNLSSLGSGMYSVTISDAAGCSFAADYEIIAPAAIDVTITSVPPTCNTSDGEAHATVTNAPDTVVFTYTWTDGGGNVLSGDSALTGVSAGIYYVSVENQFGCVEMDTLALSSPGGDVTAAITNESCAGSGDGSVELTISGLLEPIQVEWTGPNGFISNDTNLYGLSAGTYTYTVTGSDGCTHVGTADITAPVPMTMMLAATGMCYGESTGTITLDIFGGSSPYTVTWSGPDGFASTDEDLTDLVAGMYVVDVQDSNGCNATDSIEVVESSPMEYIRDVQHVTCHGAEDGAIAVQFTGGSTPIDVVWEGPGGFTSTSDTITNLAPGLYTAYLTDSLSCSDTISFEIQEPAPLVVNADYSSPGCAGPDDLGSISIFPSGGTGGYFISWSGPDGFSSTAFDLFDLESGVFHYTVTDVEGCTLSDSITLVSVSPLSVAISSSNVSCYGDTNGSASASPSGGLPPYSFAWAGPNGFSSTDSTVQGLIPGSYEVFITDSAGCAISQSLVIVEPEPLEALVTQRTDPSCNTSSDGALVAGAAGGTPPYSFFWFDLDDQLVSDSSHAGNLAGGDYVLVVTDSAGCSDTTFTDLVPILNMTADAGTDLVICQADLPVTLFGVAPDADSFIWTLDGDTLSTTDTVTIEGLLSGDRELLFTGYNALCSVTDTLQVTILENPVADAGPDLQVFVEEYFTLGGNPTGETATDFHWSPSALGGFDPLAPNPTGYLESSTQFVVTVTDDSGCSATDTVFVEVLPDLEITSGFTPNGDGINDTWVIDNIELFPNCVVHVFNRWGVSVYESVGYGKSEGWDGTFEGKDVPIGTYYYTIELNDSRFPEPLTGPVTIHR